MSEDLKEFQNGNVILPDGVDLYWEKEDGYRTYYIAGEKIFVAKYPNFVIAAAVAVEENLAYEERKKEWE